MSVKLEVWGDYALFTQPEFKAERVSYDVMTPSAARGILDSIMWHPGMHWVIDRIHVCNPVRLYSLTRNEISEKASAKNIRRVMETGHGKAFIDTSQCIVQRSSLILTDVRYVIEAHFDMTDKAAPGDSPAKFQGMAERRIRKGQSYRGPYFGCREFRADFKSCKKIPECPSELKGEIDLGYMLWDMDYSQPDDIKPLIFKAVLRDGVLEVPARDSKEVIGG